MPSADTIVPQSGEGSASQGGSSASPEGSSRGGPSHLQRIKLRPRHGWQAINLAELWHYRELLWILTLRDIKVSYKQTVLGALWAIIQPLVSTIIFTIVFTHMAGLPTDGIPAPIFFYAGQLPWLLFATALTSAGNSLIGNQNLITKVYFPRLAIPISAVMVGLIDFAIAFSILIVMMIWYHWPITAAVLLMPFFVALTFLAALGAGLWLSALNVEFRDVRYIIPFLTQFWFYATPIVYPASMAKRQWMRTLMGLNPLSGCVEGFRWCMLRPPKESAPNFMLLISVAMILLVLIGGMFYFRRMEKTFADLV
jgi:lipopolysaccharide transport system permease protein